jgi:tungstate transport system substrate-binding protein
MKRALLGLGLLLASVSPGLAQAPTITVAATTSFADSGLAGALLPKFTAATGIAVNLLSRGSGEDLYLAQKGFVDVVLVNNPEAVARFAASGHVEPPRRLMANKFIIVGPASNPARLNGATDRIAALRAIAYSRAPFVSRADNSGTHQAERRVWEQAGVRPKLRSGNWYREVGLGMAESLDLAAKMQAYIFTDRGTWRATQQNIKLPVVVEEAGVIDNQYEVMAVNPKQYPRVKALEAKAFVDWLTSEEGQSAIANYRIDGEQVYFPNARSGS